MNIPVLLGSTRSGRNSDRVAKFIVRKLQERSIETGIVDLAELDIPWLDTTYAKMENPSEDLRTLHDRIVAADALVVVAPEYNGQMPGVLKNALDHFYAEYRRKPVGIATVSSGDFAGTLVMNQLRLWAVRVQAIPTAAAFNVPRVAETFDEDGVPTHERTERFAERFFDDLVWFAEAVGRQLESERED